MKAVKDSIYTSIFGDSSCLSSSGNTFMNQIESTTNMREGTKPEQNETESLGTIMRAQLN